MPFDHGCRTPPPQTRRAPRPAAGGVGVPTAARALIPAPPTQRSLRTAASRLRRILRHTRAQQPRPTSATPTLPNHPQARAEACCDLLRGEWEYPLQLGRLALKAYAAGAANDDTKSVPDGAVSEGAGAPPGEAGAGARGAWLAAAAARLSLYATACRLASEGGGQLHPLVRLHGARLKMLAAAARLLRGDGDGHGNGDDAGGQGGSGGSGGDVAAALALVAAAARHCFGRDAAERLAAMRAPPAGGRSGGGSSSGGSSGGAPARGRRARRGAAADRPPATAAAALGPAWAAAVGAAVRVAADDCTAALRYCQQRYALPGQLHAAAYRLARGLALMGR